MEEVRTGEWCAYSAFGHSVVRINALDCPLDSSVCECDKLNS